MGQKTALGQAIERAALGLKTGEERPSEVGEAGRRPELSPMNPSRRATARVKNPLPLPDRCPHDGGEVEILPNAVVYGRLYGEWPWVLICKTCDAYVGFHPFTGIPLGTLATAEIRLARKTAKEAFNVLWQDRHMSRDDAYAWLANELGIPDVNACHIGWFGVEQCEAALDAVQKWILAKGPAARPKRKPA